MSNTREIISNKIHFSLWCGRSEGEAWAEGVREGRERPEEHYPAPRSKSGCRFSNQLPALRFLLQSSPIRPPYTLPFLSSVVCLPSLPSSFPPSLSLPTIFVLTSLFSSFFLYLSFPPSVSPSIPPSRLLVSPSIVTHL